MNCKAELLYHLGEPLAAGMYENESAPQIERCALGIRRYFENLTPPAESGNLYPGVDVDIWNQQSLCVYFHYSFGFRIKDQELREKGEKLLTEPFHKALLNHIIMELTFFSTSMIPPRNRVGGSGWTHTILNYRRILKEGLQSYCDRVEKMSPSSLKKSLQDTLAGITGFLKRAPGNIAAEVMAPAKDFYSAMRIMNFFAALDQYDSIGRFDDYIGEYYKGETDAGEWVGEFFHAMETHKGWNMLYTNKYPDFTTVCLKAQKYSRPSSSFLINKNTPDAAWDAIFDNWERGMTNPALYNEEKYLQQLTTYAGIAPEDAGKFAFGGCTETMIEGCSNIGSTEAGINLPAVFVSTTPEDFRAAIKRNIDAAFAAIKREDEFAKLYRPQLIRTLFVDDCIDRELEFRNGGARYYGSHFCVGGLPNAANCLAAVQGIREKYGNDKPEVDRIAADLAKYIFSLLRQYKGRGNGTVYPVIVMLNGYADKGMIVDATPDGRAAGTPIADSVGPVAGTDVHGLTAMLKSVASLPLELAIGSPTLNCRLQKNLLVKHRSEIKALIKSFFEMGGMQLQPTIADQETLLKALDHPEDYPDLLIRIGGFSAYFTALKKSLQLDVIKRTEHNL